MRAGFVPRGTARKGLVGKSFVFQLLSSSPHAFYGWRGFSTGRTPLPSVLSTLQLSQHFLSCGSKPYSKGHELVASMRAAGASLLLLKHSERQPKIASNVLGAGTSS